MTLSNSSTLLKKLDNTVLTYSSSRSVNHRLVTPRNLFELQLFIEKAASFQVKYYNGRRLQRSCGRRNITIQRCFPKAALLATFSLESNCQGNEIKERNKKVTLNRCADKSMSKWKRRHSRTNKLTPSEQTQRACEHAQNRTLHPLSELIKTAQATEGELSENRISGSGAFSCTNTEFV